ncbi:N-methylhydantoinase A [Rhodothalassium salexigens DSM 2132]|uniref:N-methylhydantoinase A n=1 Tax=Rhodothalassium salexigens DSM 2132 TaxID=1188247 RepID=A0A4R2PIF0_RHOSA|nr:hydantoinase/oxoprolinase family protein [Rhodothalassium salexigens]MBB4211604.1 N-methylhydantoinase A [Rhodothalassium salexigens DSM 2132]MBK1639555.1 methylhydantoinase [Rhodothalassium salexigens DSM 2132]TCP34464.1 N-methylhydantoinase A [Rhodothalassium salexigens DSM 2132]
MPGATDPTASAGDSGDRRLRLAVDIGGTFTDVALAHGDRHTTTKVLTTHADPAQGVLDGIATVLAEAGRAPAEVALIIHGTTLATNALIERRGARTALLTTAGHRDALAMGHEDRFEQYDLAIERPVPLVPRHLRLPVVERLDSAGRVRVPLDEASLRAHLGTLRDQGVESVAIGFLHGYANGAHEARAAEILAAELPDLWITRAGEVCPEIREYERLSTAVANAYVRPVMARYLTRLAAALGDRGLACPFLLMTSGGGLTTVETAARFPIRLVESGPAGGAILAAQVARDSDAPRVLSFDMGGTTAKLCLIDDAEPLSARQFEVDRVYRFKKGSGLPVRIPVIEMVEIGAGGGSIARVDALGRVQVGPESAGSDPGPACYARGGDRPTVTDADLCLGRIPAAGFAGGALSLDPGASTSALAAHVARPLGQRADASAPPPDSDSPAAAREAAHAVSEMVDETMSAAARAHGLDWGRHMAGRTLVAFGGAAPLHAARLAQKLGCDRVVVPKGAGVGSAIGFLLAPVSYQVVRSRFMTLDGFDAAAARATLAAMDAEARTVVRQAAPDRPLEARAHAHMRYRGQGHEIAVALPDPLLDTGDAPARPETLADTLARAFDAAYAALYGRTIPGQDIEILSWTLSLSAPATLPPAPPPLPDTAPAPPAPLARQPLFDPARQAWTEVPVIDRAQIAPGTVLAGPALVAEAQTTTVVPADFSLAVDARGALVLTRAAAGQPA